MRIECNEQFSVFSKGYLNKRGEAVLAARPQQTQTIGWVGKYIKSERARWATETLRSMVGRATKDELAEFKKLNFETATFNGVFSYRNARSLVTQSPFMVLDIDDLTSYEEAQRVKHSLVSDPSVETALCFISPKGMGVKWVVRLPRWAQDCDFKTAFTMLQQHVGFEHGIAVDRSGSDICRACFLPHDSTCYIHQNYI